MRTLDSTEEETLKEEEDTSTDTGKSEENDTDDEEDTSSNDSDSDVGDDDEDDEESVEALKARLQKAEEDRDNYKKGMLSAKSKKRVDKGLTKTSKPVDVNEEAMVKILSKREEKKALVNTISSAHSDYIPELVDENQYNEIIGYLPRNVDKTSYSSIVRGLKLATKMWKEEKGIKDKSAKKDTNLQTTKTTTASNSTAKKKKSGLKLLVDDSSVDSWYN